MFPSASALRAETRANSSCQNLACLLQIMMNAFRCKTEQKKKISFNKAERKIIDFFQNKNAKFSLFQSEISMMFVRGLMQEVLKVVLRNDI